MLSDPWFFGDAFHKGWNLLYQNSEREIHTLLEKTSHIWISHEHPDHFSVPFFRKYKDLIKDNNVEILFQKTRDGRVKNFLESIGLNVRELPYEKNIQLGEHFSVACFKNGFYDSLLCANVGEQRIVNLNDCEFSNEKELRNLHRKIGNADVLLTQFSYAAWKGGEDNEAWRISASDTKLETLKRQARVFNAETVIPFASFVYFSNNENSILNKNVNRPSDVMQRMGSATSNVVIMKPGDCFDGQITEEKTIYANKWWDSEYDKIPTKPKMVYKHVELDTLRENYVKYIERVWSKNNKPFISFVRRLSPIGGFKPVVLQLKDIGAKVIVDLDSKKLETTNLPADIELCSESLDQLFKNPFGFDTLTVNGCFEELKTGGFERVAKTLAIENLNNLGFSIGPKLLVNYRVIMIFLRRLLRLRRHIASG